MSDTDLNEKQWEAVSKTEGPVIILAGAGTGKTKTITTRIAQIIKDGIAEAPQILAVTFTNKAAKEMRDRIDNMVGYPVRPWVQTFHAAALLILRQNVENIKNFSRDFTISDADEQQKLIKSIANEIAPGFIDRTTHKKFTSRYILGVIQNWKDNAKTPEQAAQIAAFRKNQQLQQIAKIYGTYQERLQKNNSMDFGDLLIKNIELFTNQDILQKYQNKFKYITIDEYQDTNTIQYQWAKLLAKQHNNICCVGDGDQSIYSWRGAKIENIMNFMKDFPNFTLVKLEKNYRSTTNILNIASSIISYNKNRIDKRLYSDMQHVEKAKIIKFPNQIIEANHIINQIVNTKSQNPERDCIILIRSNSQSRIFEDMCVKKNIPYQIIGGMRFYDRAVIKDMIAYLKVTLNPDNDMALQRIINKPKRSIGEVTFEKALSYAMQNGSTIVQSINDQTLNQKIKTKIIPVVSKIKTWHELSKTEKPAELLKIILNDSGYKEMLNNNKDNESLDSLNNINELINFLYSFNDLGTFLEQIALNNSADNSTEEVVKIKIMTIHAAKGLEFHSVFLPNWNDGVFPNRLAIEDSAIGIEEERRLAYVAITRAREQLCISYSASGINNGTYSEFEKSRFINEIDQEDVNFVDLSTGNLMHRPNKKQNKFNNINRQPENKQKSLLSIIGKKIDHPELGRIIVLSASSDMAEVLSLKSCSITKIPLAQLKIFKNI
ncbi:putative DNA helicase II homolog [Candidatus Xenohaliotis californiensis]|uniref:DNA 3'-5' helicase n=1 Tax=Candidatus Xenohaliotis californiensis TaxID=84677 RepID=A0ABM9N8T5_9RICK|nr:putative DNA helicase II homolog [Candidatus Xenohaliotis californiensis]